MAITVKSSFQKLKENLEITNLQTTTVSTRQQNIRKAVADEMTVHDSFLTGSYSRNTLIAPLNEADIDIFIVLDSSYYHDLSGPVALLEKVKNVLKITYPKTPDISRNGQAVTIQFTDFMVDVVPGFKRQGGGFLIPNSVSNNWIETDPKKHVEIMSSANSSHNSDLVPLIKMIKGWNKKQNSHFSSFHLEVLALHILKGVTISDFPSGIRYFFDKCRDLISKKNLDPAGYGGDVGSYINTQEKIKEAVDILQLAYDRALKGEEYDRQGYVKSAIETWQKVFDDYFPAYG